MATDPLDAAIQASQASDPLDDAIQASQEQEPPAGVVSRVKRWAGSLFGGLGDAESGKTLSDLVVPGASTKPPTPNNAMATEGAATPPPTYKTPYPGQAEHDTGFEQTKRFLRSSDEPNPEKRGAVSGYEPDLTAGPAPGHAGGITKFLRNVPTTTEQAEPGAEAAALTKGPTAQDDLDKAISATMGVAHGVVAAAKKLPEDVVAAAKKLPEAVAQAPALGGEADVTKGTEEQYQEFGRHVVPFVKGAAGSVVGHAVRGLGAAAYEETRQQQQFVGLEAPPDERIPTMEELYRKFQKDNPDEQDPSEAWLTRQLGALGADYVLFGPAGRVGARVVEAGARAVGGAALTGEGAVATGARWILSKALLQEAKRAIELGAPAEETGMELAQRVLETRTGRALHTAATQATSWGLVSAANEAAEQVAGEKPVNLRDVAMAGVRAGAVGAAGGVVGSQIANPVGRVLAEVGAWSTVQAAQEGRMPNAWDFIEAGAPVGVVMAATGLLFHRPLHLEPEHVADPVNPDGWVLRVPREMLEHPLTGNRDQNVHITYDRDNNQYVFKAKHQPVQTVENPDFADQWARPKEFDRYLLDPSTTARTPKNWYEADRTEGDWMEIGRADAYSRTPEEAERAAQTGDITIKLTPEEAKQIDDLHEKTGPSIADLTGLGKTEPPTAGEHNSALALMRMQAEQGERQPWMERPGLRKRSPQEITTAIDGLINGEAVDRSLRGAQRAAWTYAQENWQQIHRDNGREGRPLSDIEIKKMYDTSPVPPMGQPRPPEASGGRADTGQPDLDAGLDDLFGPQPATTRVAAGTEQALQNETLDRMRRLQELARESAGRGVPADRFFAAATSRGADRGMVLRAMKEAYPGFTPGAANAPAPTAPPVPTEGGQGRPETPEAGQPGPAQVPPAEQPPAGERPPGARGPEAERPGQAPQPTTEGVREGQGAPGAGATGQGERPAGGPGERPAPGRPGAPERPGEPAGARPAATAFPPREGAGTGAGGPGLGAADGGAEGGRASRVGTIRYRESHVRVGPGGRFQLVRGEFTRVLARQPGDDVYLSRFGLNNDVQEQGFLRMRASVEGPLAAHFLADGTGVGKTRQLLAMAQYLLDRGNKVIYVAPANALKIAEKNKTNRKLPDEQRIAGTLGKEAVNAGMPLKLHYFGPVEPGILHVLTYEKFKALIDPRDPATKDLCVILDEAHYLKNVAKGTGRAVHGLQVMALPAMEAGEGGVVRATGNFEPNAKVAIMATATPIDTPNQLAFLWRAGVYEGKKERDAMRDLGMVMERAPNGKGSYWKAVNEAETDRRLGLLFDRLTYNGGGRIPDETQPRQAWALDHDSPGTVTQRELAMEADIPTGRQVPSNSPLQFPLPAGWPAGPIWYKPGDMVPEMHHGQVQVHLTSIPTPPELYGVYQRILDGFAGHPGASFESFSGMFKARVLHAIRRATENYKLPATVQLVKKALADPDRQVVIYVDRINEAEAGLTEQIRDIHGNVVDEIRHIFHQSEGTVPDLIKKLQDEGVIQGEDEVAQIHSKRSGTQQIQAMQDFQSGKKRVAIATVGSGATGIDLDDQKGGRPRTMIIVTAPFTPIEAVQAMGRIWRQQTMSFPETHFLHSEMDIDRWNIGIIARKLHTLGAALSGPLVQSLDLDRPPTPAELHRASAIPDDIGFREPTIPAAPKTNDVYHGTGTAFEKLNGPTWVAEHPDTAAFYSQGQRMQNIRQTGQEQAQPNIRPYRMRNDLKLANEADFNAINNKLEGLTPEERQAEIVQQLQDRGYDGVSFKGSENRKGTHYLVFDPKDLTERYTGEAAGLDDPRKDSALANEPAAVQAIRNPFQRAALQGTGPQSPAANPPRADLLQQMRDFLNIPIGGKRGLIGSPSNVLGHFVHTPGKSIDLRNVGDIQTLAHEAGHYLSNLLFGSQGRPSPERSAFFQRYQVALDTMSQTHAKPTPEEGFAEFTRLYMTNPHLMRTDPLTQALTLDFEQRMQKKDPVLWQALQNWSQDYRAWRGGDLNERIKGKIAFDPVESRSSVQDTLSNLYMKIFHRYGPIENMVQDMYKGKVPDKIVTPDMAATLLSNANSLVERFLFQKAGHGQGGAFDFNTRQRTGKALDEVLEPIKDNYRDWSAYMVEKRLAEFLTRTDPAAIRSRRALYTAMETNPQEVQRAVTEWEAAHPEFLAAHDDFQAWNDSLVKYLVDGNMLSRQQAATIRDLNRSYLPFYRVFSSDEMAREAAAQGYGGGGPKRLKGSGRDFLNPLEGAIRNAYMYIKAAEKNSILLDMSRLAEREWRQPGAAPAVGEPSGEGQSWMKRVPAQLAATRVPPKEIMSRVREDLIQAGVPEPVVDAVLGGLDHPFVPQFVTLFRADHARLQPNEVVVMDRGKPQHFIVDPLLKQSIDQLVKPEADLLNRIYQRIPTGVGKSIAQNLIEGPARLLRAGATLAPEFAVRNPLRDVFDRAWFSARQNPVPFVGPLMDLTLAMAQMPRGAISSIRGDKWKQALERGGGQMVLANMDIKGLNRKLDDVLKGRPDGLSKGWVLNPIHWMRTLSQISEEANRIEEFRYNLQTKLGVTDPTQATKEQLQVAAHAAATNPLDFSRMGTYMKETGMNRAAAFSNVSLASWDKVARELTGPHALQRLHFAVAAVTIPSLLLWYYNHDDARWAELPQWQKDLGWIFFTKKVDKETWDKLTPEQQADPNVVGHVIRLPKPWQLGILFGSVPERIADWAAGVEGPGFAASLYKSLSEARLNLPIPTGLQTIWALATNYDGFTGRPIISRGMQDMAPEDQIGPGTHHAAIWLAHGISSVSGGLAPASLRSPQAMDAIFYRTGGNLGRLGGDLVDYAAKALDVGPPEPAGTWADIPGFRGFVSRFPTSSAESIEQFYQEYTALQQVGKGAKWRAKNDMDADAYADQHGFDLAALPAATMTAQALSRYRTEMRGIQLDPDLTPAQKRAALDSTTLEMISTAREALMNIRSVRAGKEE